MFDKLKKHYPGISTSYQKTYDAAMHTEDSALLEKALDSITKGYEAGIIIECQ